MKKTNAANAVVCPRGVHGLHSMQKKNLPAQHNFKATRKFVEWALPVAVKIKGLACLQLLVSIGAWATSAPQYGCIDLVPFVQTLSPKQQTFRAFWPLLAMSGYEATFRELRLLPEPVIELEGSINASITATRDRLAAASACSVHSYWW